MTFSQVVCWERKNLQQVADIEAGSFEHRAEDGANALFLAVHQPTSLLQMPDKADAQGALVDEAELRKEFTRAVGAAPHLVFLVGKKGTGKSHMVKWLAATIGDHPDWHEVYIEKRNTSLRRVIETILEDLEGPRIDALRAQLREVARSLSSLEEAKSRLLSELAQLVEFDESDVPSVEKRWVDHLRPLLPALLNDPETRRKLLESGGVVERITRLAYDGCGPDDDLAEEDLRLSEADLPLKPEDLLALSAETRNLVSQLLRLDKLRGAALALLNYHLAAAKARVFTGKDTDLVSVFEEVREELARRKQELCLYIEDLVLLHGIDKELAQVLTIGRGPVGKMCGLRAAIAVTDGYLDSIATFRSRGVRFSLDLKLGPELTTEAARSFVTRYMNAARVGSETLVEARRANSGPDWVPNACDSCRYDATACHEGFSTSAGYGLYPFNELAVDRLAVLAGGGNFNPREVIREVIRHPLEVAEEELEDGVFPSGQFAKVLDPGRTNVSSEVKTQLRRLEDPARERRISLLSFWGGGATTLGNLDRAIHDAFALPRLDDIGDHEPEVQPETDRGTGIDRSPAEKEIEKWANGDVALSSETVRIIRQSILEAITGLISSSPTGVKVTRIGPNRFRVGSVELHLASVRIPDSGRAVALGFSLVFEKNETTSVLFKSIVRSHHQRSWEWDTDGTEYAAFRDVVAEHAAAVSAAGARTLPVDLEPAVTTLALCSRVNGEPPPDADTAAAHLMSPLRTADDRSTQWKTLTKSAEAARGVALATVRDALSTSKGDGAPSVFDCAPVMKALTLACKTVRVPNPIAGTKELVEAQSTLKDAQAQAARFEWQRLGALLLDLGNLLGPDDRWDGLQQSVTEALTAAGEQGLLPGANTCEELAELRDAVDPRSVERYRVLARAKSAAAAPPESLWELVPDPNPGLDRLREYLDRAQRVLVPLRERVQLLRQDGGQPDVPVSAVHDVLRELSDVFDNIAKES